MGPDFLLGRLSRPIDTIQTKAFCSFNEDCVVNASCSAPSSINAVRDAVAHILFRSGAFYYICSGGLLADTTQSGTPYFLTANHCLSKGNEANSLETYFQYSTSCNNPDCSSPYGSPRNPDTLGGTVLSTNKTSDYTLLQLAQAPPSGSAFLGWSSAPVATSWNTPLYRISHPKGAPQAYSEHRVKDYGFACNSWPVGPWIYSEDLVGATEGGSSGSPVVILDGGPKVVGQLSGACGYSPSDVCNTIDNATVDGALAHYFSSVESWLAPGGDGGGGGGGGGGGECKPAGESCSSNSECCSNKCRGGPNNSTCRN
jgi:hypothetical protein